MAVEASTLAHHHHTFPTNSSQPSIHLSQTLTPHFVFEPSFFNAPTIPPAFIWPEAISSNLKAKNHQNINNNNSSSAAVLSHESSSPPPTSMSSETRCEEEVEEEEEEEEEVQEEEEEEEEEEEDIVPTIDLSKWRSKDPESMAQVVKEACEAGKGIGFFQVVNHGVAEELIEAAHRHSRAFFKLPSSVKQRAQRVVGESYGYSSSFTARFSSRLPWKETFSLQPSPVSNISSLFHTLLHHSSEQEEKEEEQLHPFYYCNQQSSSSSSSDVFELYSRSMIGLGLEVLDVLSVGLGLGVTAGVSSTTNTLNTTTNTYNTSTNTYNTNANTHTNTNTNTTTNSSSNSMSSIKGGGLRRFFDPEHSSILRLNNYPRCQQPWLTYGTGPHTDPTGLTILHQDHVAGLQVFHRARWYTVPPRSDAFVINIGDTLMALSNGRYKSCLHRALVNRHEERGSIAFFFNPGLHLVLSAPAELVDESHPRAYRDFTWANFLYFTQSVHRSSVNTLHTFNQWLATTAAAAAAAANTN